MILARYALSGLASDLWLAAIFVLGALTDWLDGYLARKFRINTPFGAYIDPVADKLLVATALGFCIESYQNPIVTLSAIVILLREIAVSALREFLARRGTSLKVSPSGKLKTTLQFIALVFLLGVRTRPELHLLASSLLALAALSSLVSFIQYAYTARKSFQGTK